MGRGIRLSIYKKYKTLNIRFEYLPEAWSPMLYYFYFNQKKDYYYPTDDDIKFFYFTLFKTAITFYLILCLIYTIFYIRKHVRIGVSFLYKTPIKLYPLLFI